MEQIKSLRIVAHFEYERPTGIAALAAANSDTADPLPQELSAELFDESLVHLDCVHAFEVDSTGHALDTVKCAVFLKHDSSGAA